MADKQTKLSIVIRAVDAATSKIKAINDRLDKLTKPFRDLGEQLGDLRGKSGLDDVIAGFKGVGSALAGVLSKVAVAGGVIGVAVAGLFKLVDGFDELGDKAEAIGVSVDFLASMRYAAERSGAAVADLDGGLASFSKNLGLARANSGPLVKFLSKVSPVLLKQLKATKTNEEAFDLLAGAMSKLEDPAKRAALAQKTLGDASLAPLFAKGPKGIKELRDRYLDLAGSQEGAAKEAGSVDDAMKDFKASTDGVKAALVEGLAPALTQIVDRLRDFFKDNRARIAEWAAGLGKKLPAAFDTLVGAVKGAIGFIKPFVDSSTKLKAIALVLAGVIVGPLVSAIYTLGVALLTTPVGWIVAGLAAIGLAAAALINDWGGVRTFFVDLWDTLGEKFGIVRDITAVILAPFIYVPAKIIANWGAIVDFFRGLWDGVTAVFRNAWEIISGIVDKVVGAVATVRDAVGTVFSDLDVKGLEANIRAKAGGATSDAATAILGAGKTVTESKITLDITGAPRGTRVTTDPASTADVDLNVGYQLLPGIFR